MLSVNKCYVGKQIRKGDMECVSRVATFTEVVFTTVAEEVGQEL